MAETLEGIRYAVELAAFVCGLGGLVTAFVLNAAGSKGKPWSRFCWRLAAGGWFAAVGLDVAAGSYGWAGNHAALGLLYLAVARLH